MNGYYKAVTSLGIEAKQDVGGEVLTTFGSGGKVACLAKPSDVNQTATLVEKLQNEGIPYIVLGGGSNVILSDEGYHGVVISLALLNAVAFKGGRVVCGAGAKCPVIAAQAVQRGLSGVEFLSHIPASFGGACVCNAAAFGQSVDAVLESVTVLDGGEVKTLAASALEMSYHRARLPGEAIVLGGRLRLVRSDEGAVRGRVESMWKIRQQTQPMARSAGSVFRKAGEVPAACLIERTGLKGSCIGGAKLSEKHCNFIVNTGGARSEDFFALAELVRQKVFEDSGVLLEYEVEKI